jgi:hypothetical protein
MTVTAIRGMAVGAALAVSLACSSEPSPAPPTPAGAASPATTMAPATTTPPMGTVGTSPGPAAVAEIGIPECDSYVRKYETCVQRHAPAGQRAQLQQALDQSRAAWRAAAAQPQGQAMLKTMCAQAEAAAKASMGAYGCQW